jgi:sugar (pentulose or hexulose) kinase
MNVIAVFDVGKTNKKLFLFDGQYRLVAEQSESLSPGMDEDGDPCEDLPRLTEWVRESLAQVMARPDIRVRAVNFSAYGASFVHLGADGQPVAPLYNYLKPYPTALKRKFYDTYGGEVTLSMLTASPVLGSLNSGMQLYRIRQERPELFGRIKYSLHLPQYLSYLLTGKAVSDITSIGCHTNLWNFQQQRYHDWVYREGLIEKLAPIVSSGSVMPAGELLVGVGLHDSSAAIIPYLEGFREPFVLISTGTWCISLNPFNDTPLTEAELRQDCLCYMSYLGRPVKASRLFAGYDHEQQVQRLADYFQRPPGAAAAVGYNPECVVGLRARRELAPTVAAAPVTASVFGRRDLAGFESFEQAYHCLLMDIMDQQVKSTRLVLDDTDVRRICVDGGFGKNKVYMHLLAEAFPDAEVFAASISQATALGAALAIHEHWNKGVVPGEMVELKRYK